MRRHLVATSEYIPDTTLHRLNGEFVVDIGGLKEWLKGKDGRFVAPWLSVDEAESLAASLVEAASLARQYRESDFDDGSEATS